MGLARLGNTGTDHVQALDDWRDAGDEIQNRAQVFFHSERERDGPLFLHFFHNFCRDGF